MIKKMLASAATLALVVGVVATARASVVDHGQTQVGAEAAVPLQYVGLGDSFSSGEGVPPFIEGTDVPSGSDKNLCHRSFLAYPMLLQAQSADRIQRAGFFACSGAKTGDLRNRSQYRSQPSQLGSLGALSGVNLVTLTAGGNDINFDGFASSCVFPHSDRDCTKAYNQAVKVIDEKLPALLGDLYADLLSKINSSAEVLVLGYPKIVVAEADEPNCQVATGGMTQLRRILAIDLTNRLNEAISLQVADAGSQFTYLDATAAGSPFAGHELCTDEPFFNGPNASNRVYSFHPNSYGQQAYAEMVMDYLFQQSSDWSPGTPMVTAHTYAALVRLQDGRLLVASGSDGSVLTTDAEIYDPSTGQWTQTGNTNQARFAFRPPVLLPSGKVLVAGGHDANVIDYATAELYDPTTGQWTFTGSLNTSRRYPVIVPLADGRVLAATGSHGVPDGSRFLSSSELYDPVTGQWTYTGSASERRESASGIRLNDGRVLLLGGYTCCDYFLPDTELYDPATGTWSRAGDMPTGRAGAAVVLLPGGRVLAAGGGTNVSGPFNTAIIFDPVTGQWTPTGNMNLARSGANAVALTNGKILIAGGGPLESEIYDPVTGTWSLDAPLSLTHAGGSMALLPDGRVLMAGGGTSSEGRETEIYTPAP